MTLTELQAETLTQKHRRQQQERCAHEEVYSSAVTGPRGTFENKFCLDGGVQLQRMRYP